MCVVQPYQDVLWRTETKGCTCTMSGTLLYTVQPQTNLVGSYCLKEYVHVRRWLHSIAHRVHILFQSTQNYVRTYVHTYLQAGGWCNKCLLENSKGTESKHRVQAVYGSICLVTFSNLRTYVRTHVQPCTYVSTETQDHGGIFNFPMAIFTEITGQTSTIVFAKCSGSWIQW